MDGSSVCSVSLRVSREDRARLYRAAANAGTTVSAWLRGVILPALDTADTPPASVPGDGGVGDEAVADSRRVA